jgi:lipopolysaccharide export LptBFGC system permease protein LptF
MSELKTANQHNAPIVGESESPEHTVDFRSYVRRCLYILVAVLCAISLMIFISYLPQSHYSWTAKVALILCVACVNAFLVAGFLMHLLSEKKLIYTLLAFTVFFFAGLIGLTVYAMQDMPHGTIYH